MAVLCDWKTYSLLKEFETYFSPESVEIINQRFPNVKNMTVDEIKEMMNKLCGSADYLIEEVR